MTLVSTRHENGIIWQADGVFSPAVGLQLNEELAGQPSLDCIEYFIIDLSRVTGHISQNDSAELNVHYTHSLSIYASNMIGVFVASQAFLQAPLGLYIADMKKAGSDWDIAICDSCEDAQARIESKLKKPIRCDIVEL